MMHEPEKQLRLLDRLKDYSNRFLEVKKSFKIGEEVGLASLPKAHLYYSPANLVYNCPNVTISCVIGSGEAKVSLDNRFHYPIADFNPKYHKTQIAALEKDEADSMIFMPDLNKAYSCVISLYLKVGLYGEPGGLEKEMLAISDKALDGMVSHELAHHLEIINKVPRNIVRALKKRKEAIRSAIALRAITGEPEIDLIAAMHGYKEELIAGYEFMMRVFRKYESETYKYAYKYPTPDFIVRQCGQRKELLEYSGQLLEV